MEKFLVGGLRVKNLGHLYTSKLANLVMNGVIRLWFTPLQYKVLCIDRTRIFLEISLSYNTSALIIGMVLQVPSIFMNTVTLEIFPV